MTDRNAVYSYPEYDDYDDYDSYNNYYSRNYNSYDYNYDYDRYDTYNDNVIKETPKKQTEHARVEKARQNIQVSHAEATRNGSVVTIVLVSIMAAALFGSVIYTLDRRNTIYNSVTSLNKQLQLAESENVRLQSELESKMSAKNVEEYAENVLGMKKLDSSQITYVKTQTDDVVNIPEQEKGFFSKVKGFFDNCVEYFRG